MKFRPIYDDKAKNMQLENPSFKAGFERERKLVSAEPVRPPPPRRY